MHATTSHQAELSPDTEAQQARVDAARSAFTRDKGDRYAEDRRKQRLRRHIVGFSVFVPLWALSVIPIARESMDGRDGASAALVYLAVGAISLAVVAAIRGAYVLLTKRQFVSPWVFVLAGVLALATYSVQTAGEPVPPLTDSALDSQTG